MVEVYVHRAILNGVCLLCPQELGHKGRINLLLYLFVQGAVGDEFMDGFIPEPEESGVFMVEAPAFLWIVGEAHQAVAAGAGRENSNRVPIPAGRNGGRLAALSHLSKNFYHILIV